MARKRLFVLGNSYVEFVANVKRAPERGEAVVSNAMHEVMPGGFGMVSAVCAANLGVDTLLCTRIGDDENGEKLLATLSVCDIDKRFVSVDKRKPTGILSVISEEGAKRRTVIYPGANSSLSFEDMEYAFTSYPDAVLIDSSLGEERVVDAIKLANKEHIPVIFTCGTEIREFDFTNIGELEIFVPNKETAFRLTGIEPVDVDTALRASIKIANLLKCKYVVIKLGDRGAFVFDGTYSKIIPAHNVDVVDTAGAGTVFSASLAAAYLELENVNDAAEFANAASAFSVSKQGVFTSLPQLEDVKSIFDNSK